MPVEKGNPIMQLDKIRLEEKNLFYQTYVNTPNKLSSFFDYGVTDEEFKRRVYDLKNREYNRDELADRIMTFMGEASSNVKVQQSLEKLKSPESVVVVGGQQAGVLTGPMYTLHKIISIILLAEQQEEKLGVPVVPVFWIAGEDHDILEVNHIYVEKDKKLKKLQLPTEALSKKMVSDEVISSDDFEKLLKDLVKSLGETKHTKELIHFLRTSYEENTTYTYWFSTIINTWFAEYGLLLMDAADTKVREVEVPFFHRLIDKTSDITSAVLRQQETLRSNGFNVTLEMNEDAANLFLYENQERELLSFKREEGVFTSNEKRYTKEELRQVAEVTPSKLSNNVVTRPLMQEYLLPTLAFVAGPGEVAYWGELQTAFHEVGFTMPPVVPRLHISWVDRRMEQSVRDLDLTIEEAISGEVSSKREQAFRALQDEGLLLQIENMKEVFAKEFASIEERIESKHKSLVPIMQKNKEYHYRQLDFLVNKSVKQVERDYSELLEKYDRLERMLHPFGGYQERIWNVTYFLNKYGVSIIPKLMEQPFEFNGDHYLLFMSGE